MARPPATFDKSRKITTAITGVAWGVISYGTAVLSVGGGSVHHVPAYVMANVTLVLLLLVPYFTTHSVLLGGLRGVLKQRIILPDNAVDPGANGINMWRAGANNALIFGAVPALVGYFLVRSTTADLTARQFGIRFGLVGAILAASVAWFVAGRPLLQATRVPRGKAMYGGDPKPYLWGHFVWPHFVANAVINALLAFALSPVPFADGSAVVPKSNVLIDAAAAFVILTWIIARGTLSQARVEAEWGVAPKAAAAQKSVKAAFLPPLLASLAFTAVIAGAFMVTGAPGVNIYAWALLRGLILGGYTAWLTWSVAQAAVNGVLNAAPAAEAARQAA